MSISIIDVGTPAGLDQFHTVASGIYETNPIWVPERKTGVVRRTIQSLLNKGWSTCAFVGRHDDKLVARAMAIAPDTADKSRPNTTGWIGFFEVHQRHQAIGRDVLSACEQFLRDQGRVTAIGPKADNYVSGLLTAGFEMPQTILTSYNPPYYGSVWQERGYTVHQRLKSFVFSQERSGHLRFRVPGVKVRPFNRHNLKGEIEQFHRIQTLVFRQHDDYVARSLEEDRELVNSFLPYLDDELTLWAEDPSGVAIGIVICLPDVYQSLLGQRVDRARIVSIGAIPGYQRRGVGVALILALAKNLVAKGYRSAEASWIVAENVQPQNLARRFLPTPGREFVLLRKDIGE